MQTHRSMVPQPHLLQPAPSTSTPNFSLKIWICLNQMIKMRANLCVWKRQTCLKLLVSTISRRWIRKIFRCKISRYSWVMSKYWMISISRLWLRRCTKTSLKTLRYPILTAKYCFLNSILDIICRGKRSASNTISNKSWSSLSNKKSLTKTCYSKSKTP